MKLNPQQEEVAGHERGRILTLAGPGSGKTRTLTERTGRLIQKGHKPASILCLTFTNKARDEMRERIAAAHGDAAAKVFVSNFHGLCGILLRRFGTLLGYTERMTVCDADDQVDLLMQVARKRGLEPTKPQARALAGIANDWRENLGTPADLEALAAGRASDAELDVVRRYLEALRSRGQCDFSGLLSETVRLLRDHADVRERMRQRFRFIQVDEYQDTNRAQNEIVELLAGPEDNVLAVGDGDQSIYEWRGASPDGIPRFIKNGEAKTGTCKVVKLGVNYRSTPQIVSVADTLIRHCADRIAVEFSTVNPPGEPVKLAALETPEEEAEAVAASIQNVIRDGTPAGQTAVFYRANEMSRLIEQALAKRQIPYRVVGGGSYYDRMEVKDVLSMLRFLCNPRDGIAFHRVANKPARGMGDALVGKVEAFAEHRGLDILSALERAYDIVDEHGKPLGEAALKACGEAARVFGVPLAGRSVAQVANEVVDRSRYDEWLKERYEDKGEYDDRRRNVNELVNSIAAFCRDNPRAGVGDYLQSISLYTDGDSARDDENAVRLMSLHASKGLEFDAVYLVGVEQGVLPHERAIKDRGGRALEEERRLCYVGFTRARKLLRVTWCRKRQDAYSRGPTVRYRPSRPSQFLVESGLMPATDYEAAVQAAGGTPAVGAAPAGQKREASRRGKRK